VFENGRVDVLVHVQPATAFEAFGDARTRRLIIHYKNTHVFKLEIIFTEKQI
jgi:hypothetical protein